MAIDSNILSSLLDQKMATLQNINDVGIIWWTTTIVFSVTIIGILWKEKDNVEAFPYLWALKLAISSYYLTVLGFGV